MNKQPQVSVIIPTYNRANFIVAAVESTLNQKGFKQPYEVIVIDDGSSDDTEAVLKPYISKIRYFKIPHSGLPAVARNFGVSKAKAELIAFQDSDDLWSPDKLAQQVPLFNDPGVVMAFGGAGIINEDGSDQHSELVASASLKRGEKFQTLVKKNVISTLTVMVRKDALAKVGGFNQSPDLKAVEDYELWLRLSANFPQSLKSLNKRLAFYRTHSNNISGAGDLLGHERLLVVYGRLWESGLLNTAQCQVLEEQIDAMQETWNSLKNAAGSPPVISVVMSIYNAEKFLEKAVKSILDQTYSDFEFIIIDDGSTDKSIDVIRSFNDPRIRLIHQLNHGLVYSFNKGVRLARADFIARMDADDISMPSRFEKELVWLFSDSGRGLVGSAFSYIDAETSLPTKVTMTSPTKHIDIIRMMYIVNPFGHGSVMMRKEAVNKVGGYRPEYEPAEDYDLWRRIAQTWEVGQIPEVLYFWRLHAGSISQRKKSSSTSSAAKTVQNMWDGPIAIKSMGEIVRDGRFYDRLYSPLRKVIYEQYVDQQAHLAFEFLIHGRLRTGYRTALAAIWLRPACFKVLWKTMLWAPIKLTLGNQVK